MPLPWKKRQKLTVYILQTKPSLLFIEFLTYGQQRILQAEQLSGQAKTLYNKKDYAEAAAIFQQAFDLDPLQHNFSLNAGISHFSS